jgi:hypothetical protein
MSNPSSPVELTQTTSTPGTGEFWVAEQGAQSDYGQVNLGFGFVEVHSSMNGVLIEVHYQSVGSVLSNDVINDKITTEVTSQLVASTPYDPGLINGLTISNNGSDATNDIDIAAGYARDSTNTVNMILAAAITKRLDAAWAVGTNQGGLDTGLIANTTYHVWLIKRSDTGVVDVLFSASATAPTMPANYDSKRRLLGIIVRSGGSILGFSQLGDMFFWDDPVLDVDTTIGTSSVSYTMRAAPYSEAIVSSYLYKSAATPIVYVRPLTATDTGPSDSAAALTTIGHPGSVGGVGRVQFRVLLDGSSQFGARADQAGVTIRLSCVGYRDLGV